MEKEFKRKGYIFVILGQAGAGKSSAAIDVAKELDMPKKITCTTRIPREDELDGVDYHFITQEQYNNLDLVCKEQHEVIPNGIQYYGVKRLDLETDEDIIIVLSPSGYRELKKRYKDRVIGIYIMSSKKDRFERYISRDPNDKFVIAEAKRRLETDERDFYEFEYEVDLISINNKSYKHLIEDLKYLIILESL